MTLGRSSSFVSFLWSVAGEETLADCSCCEDERACARRVSRAWHGKHPPPHVSPCCCPRPLTHTPLVIQRMHGVSSHKQGPTENVSVERQEVASQLHHMERQKKVHRHRYRYRAGAALNASTWGLPLIFSFNSDNHRPRYKCCCVNRMCILEPCVFS